MIYVLDTHALVWHILDDPQLSKSARNAIADPNARLIIPSVVLAELKFLFHAKRITLPLHEVLFALHADPRCIIARLDEECVLQMPLGLRIFDAIIVATALVRQKQMGQNVTILTKDQKIIHSGLVKTLW